LKHEIEESNQTALTNLTEMIKMQGKTIELMAETEKISSKNIENLVNLMAEKHSGRNK
jgi:hypothetical protein